MSDFGIACICWALAICACVGCATYLIANGNEQGWGWLVFIAVILGVGGVSRSAISP